MVFIRIAFRPAGACPLLAEARTVGAAGGPARRGSGWRGLASPPSSGWPGWPALLFALLAPPLLLLRLLRRPLPRLLPGLPQPGERLGPSLDGPRLDAVGP